MIPYRGFWLSRASKIASPTTVPVFQVALDGKWESAEVVPATGRDRLLRRIIELAAHAADDDVAVELLWPGQAIVGVRWPSQLWERAADAAEHYVARLEEGPTVPAHEAVEVGLLTLLGGSPGPDVEFVELGAVNAWQQVGPETLWRRRARGRVTPPEAVSTQRPDLATCTHSVAVEFGVTSPQPCWVGIYVSKNSQSTHLLDAERLADVMRGVI